MSYAPQTDFMALLRNTSGGMRLLDMPGLDYVLLAMARMGLVRLWASQTPPVSNQTSTVWLRTALPSWSAEGQVLLWDALTSQFLPATPELWLAVLLQQSQPYVFQSVTAGADAVQRDTTLLAVQRVAPIATVLTLPIISERRGKPLQIADFSSSVANHLITLNPYEVGATIMRQTSFRLFSTPDQLSGVTLYPSVDLNAWVIAP